MLVRGRCHCGNIAFSLDWQPEPDTIPARACTCSFCTRHGGVWTSCREGLLIVAISDPGKVSHYRFGTKTATFHICAVCGVAPIVTSRIDEKLYAVVNVNTFENVDASMLRHSTISFDEENAVTRLDRRQRGWIARVEFPSCPTSV